MAQWAFVTGISRGVGKHIALKLAGRGFNVLGLSRSEPDYLSRYPGRIFWLACDLGNEGQLDSIPAFILKQTSVLDLAIFNAAEAYYGSLLELKDEQIRRMINVNFSSIVSIMRKIMSLMNENSQMIFITSSAANIPTPFVAIYGALKAAQDHLAISMNVECKNKGIAFKILRPGTIDTGFPSESGFPAETLKRKMMLSPEKVANDVVRMIGTKKIVVNSGFPSKLINIIGKFNPRWLILLSSIKNRKALRDINKFNETP